MSTINSNNGISFDEMTKEEIIAAFQETIQGQQETIQGQQETIQGQQETIQEQQETIQGQQKAFQEQQKAFQELDFENSVEKMINDFHGIPDMPQVQGLDPHEDENRAARFSVDPDFIKANDLNFAINLKDKQTGSNLKSLLFLKERFIVRDGKRILSYQNESTVADYVQAVVTMCLQSLGFFNSCFLFKEMRLFSLRPDLILVLHPEKGVILIIEVKMPGDKLFESEPIAGQVADYLVVQYRLGNSMPLVLLSSYREACLCHLKPGSLHQTEGGDGGGGGGGGDTPSISLQGVTDLSNYREFVEEGKKLIIDRTDLAAMMGDGGKEQEDSDKQKDHSPKKLAFKSRKSIPCSLLQNHAGRKKRGRSPTIHYVKPEVVYSTPFTLKNMMQGVSLALVCGLVSLKQKPANPAEVWPNQGDQLDGLHPCVESNTLKWARVENMRIDYMNPPLSTDKWFLVREIGQGKNGRVYLSVDVDGKACALKFYLDKVDAEVDFSPTVRKAKRAKNFEEAKRKAEDELQRWKSLQPGYAAYVQYLQLNQQNVLRMPVFAPVPSEERETVLSKVEAKLHEFFHKGYVYDEVRWQHIGCRRTGEDPESDLEIALLDLESLKPPKKDQTPERVVANQIMSLRKRMGTAVASGPTSALLAAPALGM